MAMLPTKALATTLPLALTPTVLTLAPVMLPEALNRLVVTKVLAFI